MKKHLAKIEDTLNDSDDSAALFKDPIIKRKPTIKKSSSSPLRKRAKISKTNSTSSEPSISFEAINTPSGSSTNINEFECFNKPAESHRKEETSREVKARECLESYWKDDEKHASKSVEEKAETSASSESESKAAGSISKFFGTKKSDGHLSLTCPLCQKKFENKSSHLSHMKQCAKKKKMSTAELLQAIERKNGNPAETFHDKPKGTERSYLGTDDDKTTEQSSYELALAVAMSVSESTASCSSKSVKIDKTAVDFQKSTLERFGFTTSSGIPLGSRRGKSNLKRKTVLRSRTAEDRQKLLTEIAAVIILSEDLDCVPEPICLKAQEEHLQFQASEPVLWDLGCSENSGLWYLPSLRENLRLEPPAKSSGMLIDAEPSDYLDDKISLWQSQKDNTSECGPHVNKAMSAICDNSIIDCSVLSQLAEPPSTLIADWQKMVNNEVGSDLTVATLDGNINLHSLVIRTRCQHFFDVDYIEAFKNVSTSSALVFLSYVYSGTLKTMTKLNLSHLTALAQVFKYSPLIKLTEDLKRILNVSGNSDDIFICNTPTGVNSPIGVNKEPTAVRMIPECSERNKHSPKTADEADTVPVSAMELDLDEVSIVAQKEPTRVSEIVDLTLNPYSPEFCDYNTQMPDWDLVANNKEERKQVQEEVMECIERAQELEKIESFIQTQSEKNQSVLNDLEKVELEESQKEREKIYGLSRSSEHDLFEDEEFVEEVAHHRHSPPPDDIIVISSDDEKNDFDVSTDDDNTEIVAKPENLKTPLLEVSYVEPPEFDDFLDYFPTEGVIAMSPVPSQSLMTSNMSPRTPKRVLGLASPLKSHPGRSTPLSLEKCNTADDVTPVLCIPDGNRLSGQGSPSTSLPTAAKLNCGVRKRRQSATQKVGNKIVKRSKKSLINRSRNVRRSTRPQREEDLLSSSVVQGLNETWEEKEKTPQHKRAYIEITPRQTPSVKLSDKVTPSPDFDNMKTVLMKKQLKRYGLKQSLGKTKAKKILQHIYNELHPVMNTKTGKFVKFLNNDEESKKTRNPSKKANVQPKKKPAVKAGCSTEKSVSPLKGRTTGDSKALDPTENDLICDLSRSFSSDGNNASNDEISGDEFGDLEDEVLTQQSGSRLPVGEAVTKYIIDSPEIHRRILCYEPIWADELRRSIHAALGIKYKLIDIMDVLDKECITFRNEAQAANNRRRNESKKNRKSPKKGSKKIPSV